VLPDASPGKVAAILGAMRQVAAAEGTLSEAASRCLVSAGRHLFGELHSAGLNELPAVLPSALATALATALEGSELAEHAVRFLIVMALVDGVLDAAKIGDVFRYAEALGIRQRYLDQLADAIDGRLAEALADMTCCNMESITNAPWAGGDVNRWLLAYQSENADPELAGRFAALGELAPDTIGHALWAHFRANAYGFPGDPSGLNAAFSLPHDTVHVLTGYDTTARGEILVSTFTAAMHPVHPMAGHILPVLLSWHIGTRINNVAGDATGALDPAEFWRAWAAGAAAGVDTFAPEWDFWSIAAQPLDTLRCAWAIPTAGLASAA
jgi:hypothetical protein